MFSSVRVAHEAVVAVFVRSEESTHRVDAIRMEDSLFHSIADEDVDGLANFGS